MIQLESKINGVPLDKLSGYGNFVRGKIKEKSEFEVFR
jgi:hypothetical protein